MNDVVIIGAGLAGLCAAIRCAQSGARTVVLAQGTGGLPLSTGTIDLLGYAPHRVTNPDTQIDHLAADHPYQIVGKPALKNSLDWFLALLPDFFTGSDQLNLQLPTGVGAIRPTAFAPQSLAAGSIQPDKKYAVVGIRQFKDFQADFVAANLAQQDVVQPGIETSPVWIDLPARSGESDTSSLNYARALDRSDFLKQFIKQLSHIAGQHDVLLLPAILGYHNRSVHLMVEEELGIRVGEVSLLPPSVPGLRLNDALVTLAKSLGVRFILGNRVTGFSTKIDQITKVDYAAAGGGRSIFAKAFLYAPGGFESGAIRVDSTGAIAETLFGLPLTHHDSGGLVAEHYWQSHKLFEVGVRIDSNCRPITHGQTPRLSNLRVAGSLVAAPERWRQKSGDGIAIATAVTAANDILTSIGSGGLQ